jgi:hypothetical protein
MDALWRRKIEGFRRRRLLRLERNAGSGEEGLRRRRMDALRRRRMEGLRRRRMEGLRRRRMEAL